MKTVLVYEDELYPYYGITESTYPDNRAIELTEAEYEQVTAADKAFREAQELLEAKYETGTRRPIE